MQRNHSPPLYHHFYFILEANPGKIARNDLLSLPSKDETTHLTTKMLYQNQSVASASHVYIYSQPLTPRLTGGVMFFGHHQVTWTHRGSPNASHLAASH